MRKKILESIKNIETPFYLYDKSVIQKNVALLKKNFAPSDPAMYYAVKANTSLAVMRTVKNSGCGAEIVSIGELYSARKAGFDTDRILYNTIARKKHDIMYALRRGVTTFNFEALDQARMLEMCARKLRRKIKIFARINPGIFSDTHPHLSTGAPSSKFGLENAPEQLNAIAKLVHRFRYARMIGIHSHIGSQILSPKPFVRNARIMGKIIDCFREKNITIQYVNLGGGFGIVYHPREKPLDYKPIARAYRDLARTYGVRIMLEPGRSIVGNAGTIVTRVLSVKKRAGYPLYIVDTGMTENPRPALYGAYHGITLITRRRGRQCSSRVAGALCENSDEFGQYQLPALQQGDMLMIRDCGAYTRTMASYYNGRLLAPEYLIEGDRLIIIRRIQQFSSLVRNEI